MLLDADDLARAGGPGRAPVCVVGGGVAGIVLALALADAEVPVLLLESGGLWATALGHDLSLGESGGYPVDRTSRPRLLGGASALWGGWCRPLEPDDVEARSWIPGSGWPIAYAALTPYYRRAHTTLDLGPFDYRTERWAPEVAGRRARVLTLPGGVETSFSQFSGRHRLGERYRDDLAGSARVTAVLGATVVGLTQDGDRVTEAEVAAPGGGRFRVTADRFVLATGGVENARLLLASGIGNAHDRVGRCFMDHPRAVLGRVHRRGALRHDLLYDISGQDRSRHLTVDGTMLAANLVLSPEVREREGLRSARVWLRSGAFGESGPGAAALRGTREARRLGGAARPGRTAYLRTAVRHPASTTAYAVGRGLAATGGHTALEVIGEPAPDPANRVTLSARTDALGQPRARVAWTVDDEVRHTLRRTAEIVAGALEAAGQARVDLPAWPDDWRSQVVGTWHHMGSTRMATDPAEGVVDPDCRVHGVDNLWVAGSSVFPGAGANFPTMTLTALALRLADHLADRVKAAR